MFCPFLTMSAKVTLGVGVWLFFSGVSKSEGLVWNSKSILSAPGKKRITVELLSILSQLSVQWSPFFCTPYSLSQRMLSLKYF